MLQVFEDAALIASHTAVLLKHFADVPPLLIRALRDLSIAVVRRDVSGIQCALAEARAVWIAFQADRATPEAATAWDTLEADVQKLLADLQS